MKVVFPKNIEKGMLAGMIFQIGPISLSIVQLFIVGVGVSAALAVFNNFSRAGAKAIGILLAVLIFLFFVFVAFFKISELALVPFIAKLVRNFFFDTTKKFQTNYDKIDPLKLALRRAKTAHDKQTIIETKTDTFDKEKIDKINDSGFI